MSHLCVMMCVLCAHMRVAAHVWLHPVEKSAKPAKCANMAKETVACRFADADWKIFCPVPGRPQHLWVLERVLEFYGSTPPSASRVANRTQFAWQKVQKQLWPHSRPCQVVASNAGHERHRKQHGCPDVAQGVHQFAMPTSLLFCMFISDMKNNKREPQNRVHTFKKFVHLVKSLLDVFGHRTNIAPCRARLRPSTRAVRHGTEWYSELGLFLAKEFGCAVSHMLYWGLAQMHGHGPLPISR